MKKILLILLFLFLTATDVYAGTVTIISPAANIVKKPSIPAVLKQKTSLVGTLSINEAISLLTRATGISFIEVHSSFIKNTKASYYFIHKPLYIILNSVINDGGYAYKYKNKEIKIYGSIARTFQLPVFNINQAFNATTGISNNNNISQSGNTSAMGTGTTAGGTGAAGAPAGMPSTASSQGGVNGNSNPGGSITSSMALTKNAVYYINKMLKPLVSKNGVFGINAMQGIVYVKDKPSHVRAVAKWVRKIRNNMAEVVSLNVQILDVTLNSSTQEGINWNAVFNDAFKLNALGMSSVTIGANLAAGAGIQSGAPSIEFANSAGTNTAILNALKTQGTVNVLSEPSLIVPNGETGTINSSSISSYVQTVETISTGISTSQSYPVMAQVSAGLSAAFTPHINKKTGTITVVINFLDNNITGYNDFNISGNSFSEPIVQSKTFADIIKVKNNHTLIMGGIISTNKSNQNYGVPILSDIPVLGWLFNGVNNTYQKDDLEMMITPRIIKF